MDDLLQEFEVNVTDSTTEMADLTVNMGPTTFMCILYVVLGIVSVFCNILNLMTWLTNRELRRKYVYLIALDASELVNAISYILVGSGRGLALIGGYLASPITVRQCFFEKYWPHSLILGTELPAFVIILISCERLCAILSPAMYNRIFLGHSKIALLAMVPIAGLISVTVGGLSTIGSAGDIVATTQHCAIISSTAIWYSTFHFVFIVFTYVVSFISIFTVRRISRKYSQGKIGGDSRMGVMLIITGSSIILIGSESIVMLFIRWNVMKFSDMVVAITYAMPGFLSILNTVINLVFRPEFRKQLFHIIGVGNGIPASRSAWASKTMAPTRTKPTPTIHTIPS
ncbi:hypothetical protein V3C99_016393 [Haemonchus contortus]